jgi:hypothetical protein
MTGIESAITAASSISAIATGFIGYYAYINHQLANAIKVKDEQHQQQIKDLFQAIVISNVIDHEHTSNNIDRFNKRYHGKTVIFPKKDARQKEQEDFIKQRKSQ